MHASYVGKCNSSMLLMEPFDGVGILPNMLRWCLTLLRPSIKDRLQCLKHTLLGWIIGCKFLVCCFLRILPKDRQISFQPGPQCLGSGFCCVKFLLEVVKVDTVLGERGAVGLGKTGGYGCYCVGKANLTTQPHILR